MREGWFIKKFGAICELKKGRKPFLHNAAGTGLMPYLVAKHLRGGQEAEFASITDNNSICVDADEIIVIPD